MSKEYTNSNSARFEDDYERLAGTCYYGEKNIDNQPSGICIGVNSKDKTMQVIDSPLHTIVSATSGSGKTTSVVLPYMISSAKKGNSMVIHDCKQELYMMMRGMLEDEGYKVVVINFREPLCGDRFNILEYPAWLYQNGYGDKAKEMLAATVKIIAKRLHSEKDAFWELTASDYMLMLILLACETMPSKEVTFENVFKLHVQGNVKMGTSSYLHRYLEDETESLIYALGAGAINAPNETKASVYSEFQAILSPFILSDELCDMTYNSTFDLESFVSGREKMAVFIENKDETSTYDPLVSAMIEQIYITSVFVAQRDFGGVLPRTIDFILDEFANLANLNSVDRMISAGRSRNIRMLIVIQSVHQLYSLYTESESKSILDNCANTVFLNSTDIDTLNMISKRCGNRENYNHTYSPLVSVDKLRTLKMGQLLMLLDRINPFFAQLPDATAYGIKFDEKFKLKHRTIQKRPPVNFTEKVDKKISDKIDKLINITDEEHKKTNKSYRKNIRKPIEPGCIDVPIDFFDDLSEALLASIEDIPDKGDEG